MAESTSAEAGRIIVAVYAIFALAATARSAYQLITRGSEAPLAYALSALAAVVYLIATWALATDRSTVATASITFELVGVITVGTLSVVAPQLFNDESVWSNFGQGYGFLPLVLPVAGLAWIRNVAQ